ncbi:hypothetical protein Scep_001703 [Stephania cephalantha]|uniref:Uncharacterized protein n=1 Tax=Stephania cephalantha TaxID=152367 RepID=A0AAP0L8H7_9MAGN
MSTLGTVSGLGGAANANPNKSVEVVQPPTDSVSSLCFSPKANFLVATSWDNQVRCWEIVRSGATTGSVPKASILHDQPVLCSAWKDDGTTVFSGGCDKQVKMWPLGGQPVTVAAHDAPIKELAWIPEMSLLVTGSWDKTLRNLNTLNLIYKDMLCLASIVLVPTVLGHSAAKPSAYATTPSICYALSIRHPLMVVGTADRNLIMFNLQNPQAEYKRIMSPLKYQTRCLAAFPDQQGFLLGNTPMLKGLDQIKSCAYECLEYAQKLAVDEFDNFAIMLVVLVNQTVSTKRKRIFLFLLFRLFSLTQETKVGSIEGRVGVQHLDDAQQSKNFTFKCHREGTEIYSVNSLNFHPVHHTFATAGSDGAFNFWDKDSKQRLKAMSRCPLPIPCSSFNNDGSIFAYAWIDLLLQVCYDWSKGAENHNPATAKTNIYLHLPQDVEVKGKPRIGTGSRK